jgi:hypothetical protein
VIFANEQKPVLLSALMSAVDFTEALNSLIEALLPADGGDSDSAHEDKDGEEGSSMPCLDSVNARDIPSSLESSEHLELQSLVRRRVTLLKTDILSALNELGNCALGNNDDRASALEQGVLSRLRRALWRLKAKVNLRTVPHWQFKCIIENKYLSKRLSSAEPGRTAAGQVCAEASEAATTESESKVDLSNLKDGRRRTPSIQMFSDFVHRGSVIKTKVNASAEPYTPEYCVADDNDDDDSIVTTTAEWLATPTPVHVPSRSSHTPGHVRFLSEEEERVGGDEFVAIVKAETIITLSGGEDKKLEKAKEVEKKEDVSAEELDGVWRRVLGEVEVSAGGGGGEAQANALKNKAELLPLISRGIPHDLRVRVWMILSGADVERRYIAAAHTLLCPL